METGWSVLTGGMAAITEEILKAMRPIQAATITGTAELRMDLTMDKKEGAIATTTAKTVLALAGRVRVADVSRWKPPSVICSLLPALPLCFGIESECILHKDLMI